MRSANFPGSTLPMSFSRRKISRSTRGDKNVHRLHELALQLGSTRRCACMSRARSEPSRSCTPRDRRGQDLDALLRAMLIFWSGARRCRSSCPRARWLRRSQWSARDRRPLFDIARHRLVDQLRARCTDAGWSASAPPRVSRHGRDVVPTARASPTAARISSTVYWVVSSSSPGDCAARGHDLDLIDFVRSCSRTARRPVRPVGDDPTCRGSTRRASPLSAAPLVAVARPVCAEDPGHEHAGPRVEPARTARGGRIRTAASRTVVKPA